jgi:hypothetical protein
MIGQNPAARSIVSALQAHLAEHMAFNYYKQIEMKLGTPLTAPGQEMPEETEILLSQVMAQAAIQNTQAKQQQLAQQQAQQKAQDPMFQLQQAEVQVKAQEVSRKAAKDAQDAQIAKDKLELDKQKAANTATFEAERIASQNRQAATKSSLDRAKALLDVAKEQANSRGKTDGKNS